MEPARLGNYIVHGSHIQNFKDSSWRATLLKNVIDKYDENEEDILKVARALEPHRYDKTVFLYDKLHFSDPIFQLSE